ncbi:MAG: hypothetical protein GVX96_04090 [Bacteroidetes bacterium]|jgi:hypothetical protein|nr:hypothetical protein [Bacteroidota bacterium]
MVRIYFAFILSFFLFLTSCAPDPTENWVEHNLIGEGVPLKVFGPEDIEVKVSQLGTMDDITIQGSDDYSLQIFGMDIQTTNMELLLAEQREMVEEEGYFKEIVKEWESGFIYSQEIDSNTVNYDFRELRVKGDKMYVFQCGMLGQNTREHVDRLVKAVRGE